MYMMNGGDPFSLQKILGHSHMNMVREIYSNDRYGCQSSA